MTKTKGAIDAVALALTSAAHAQGSVTLYGIIDAGITYTQQPGRSKQCADCERDQSGKSLRSARNGRSR
ncbi:porin (plasmid) [Paraburkholderia sp. PREW-6R]|uniref:porin n=1 Tax=Paraburkholderia sp. PREW-6R TaxID=3141544 RepID=UPI0031F5701B